jgi:hypothetical protein
VTRQEKKRQKIRSEQNKKRTKEVTARHNYTAEEQRKFAKR